MRRASHKPAASFPTTSSAPSAQFARGKVTSGSSGRNSAIAARDSAGSLPSAVERETSAARLTAEGVFLASTEGESDAVDARHRQLAIAIRQRIESRLAGRVRELAVRVRGNTIVLEGRCATYYSKQLAQHAALGVLDDEHLENEIVVAVPR